MLSSGSYVLFTRPRNFFFNKIFIKNRSHYTIHTIKNYFTTVFSLLNHFLKLWRFKLFYFLYSTQLSWLVSEGVCGVSLCQKHFPSPLCVCLFKKKKTQSPPSSDTVPFYYVRYIYTYIYIFFLFRRTIHITELTAPNQWNAPHLVQTGFFLLQERCGQL